MEQIDSNFEYATLININEVPFISSARALKGWASGKLITLKLLDCSCFTRGNNTSSQLFLMDESWKFTSEPGNRNSTNPGYIQAL